MTLLLYFVVGVVGAFVYGVAMFQIGRRSRDVGAVAGRRSGMATVELEWVGETPVAFVVCGNPADVTAWMEAAKEGPVLHV